MKVLFSDEMRMLDNKIIIENKIPSLILMENAAQGLYDACIEFENEDTIYYIFCGSGNNGGDGFALARKLLTENKKVALYMIGSKAKLKGDAKINAGYFIKNNLLNFIDFNTEIESIFNSIRKKDIIIDSLLGTGLKRDIEGKYLEAINEINKSNAKILSVDIPSGVDSDTGQVLGAAVNASFTLTFQYPKPGHFIFPGRNLKGTLRIHKIGIDKNLDFQGKIKIQAYSRASKELKIHNRQRDTHKGNYGHLAMICSSKEMSGAGLLCAKSALKSGVGILYLGVPDCIHPIFQSEIIEAPATSFKSTDGAFDDIDSIDDFMKNKNALAIGPGITTKKTVKPLIEKLLQNYQIPKVFDADALNIISQNIDMLDSHAGDVVLTPHPREFSRLSGISVNDIIKDPLKSATSFAIKHKLTVLLKGATTVIANKDSQVSLVLTGTSGMAKGGSGDVLTGIIGAFMAQGYNGYDSAVLGSYIAGIAGEYAAKNHGNYSMTPKDTIEQIAFAISSLE